jgi:hypothetical protein
MAKPRAAGRHVGIIAPGAGVPKFSRCGTLHAIL